MTAEVEAQGVPLQPLAKETTEALKTLDPEVAKDWLAKGLIYDLNGGANNNGQPVTEYVPVWELESIFGGKRLSPPTRMLRSSTVTSRASAAAPVLSSRSMAKPSEAYPDYQKRYCVDQAFVDATTKLESKNKDPEVFYFEQWLSYILTTGNNWYGPIGDFHLTVDKLHAESLVSFCGENVKKTGPTTFEMRAKDYYPMDDLNILLIVTNKVWMQDQQ